MIKYECLAWEATAYPSATGGLSYGCPSCGSPVEETGKADKPRPAAEAAPPLPELRFPDFEEISMNSSVRAIRSAEGLRERATEKH